MGINGCLQNLVVDCAKAQLLRTHNDNIFFSSVVRTGQKLGKTKLLLHHCDTTTLLWAAALAVSAIDSNEVYKQG